MEFLYCWVICIIINHIILYVYWRIKSKEETTLGDMYLYYTEDKYISNFIFIVFVWTPLNFIPIIAYIILIIFSLFSHLRIR